MLFDQIGNGLTIGCRLLTASGLIQNWESSRFSLSLLRHFVYVSPGSRQNSDADPHRSVTALEFGDSGPLEFEPDRQFAAGRQYFQVGTES
jgi:hypothetical protein